MEIEDKVYKSVFTMYFLNKMMVKDIAKKINMSQAKTGRIITAIIENYRLYNNFYKNNPNQSLDELNIVVTHPFSYKKESFDDVLTVGDLKYKEKSTWPQIIEEL